MRQPSRARQGPNPNQRPSMNQVNQQQQLGRQLANPNPNQNPNQPQLIVSEPARVEQQVSRGGPKQQVARQRPAANQRTHNNNHHNHNNHNNHKAYKNRRASMNSCNQAAGSSQNYIPRNQRRASNQLEARSKPASLLSQQQQGNREHRSLSISSSLASSSSSSASSTSSPCSSLQQIFMTQAANQQQQQQPTKQTHNYQYNYRSASKMERNLSSSSSSNSLSSGLSSGSNSPSGASSPRVPPIGADYDSLFRSTNELSLKQLPTSSQNSAFWFPEHSASFHLAAPPPRPWLQTSKQSTKEEAIHQFTVLSYNVLADRMVSNEMFPSSPNIALNWDYRRELILNQLIEFEADVIALQELELEQFETFFQPKLNQLAGYEALFEPKSRARTMDSQKRRRVDGCAIFFKSNRFKLIQRHLLEYNQIAMANAQGSEAMLNRVMTKDNIGLAAILEFIEPSRRRILVCNTHIHWDPECCDVKLIQTIMLMNELECIAKNYELSEREGKLAVAQEEELAGELHQQQQQQHPSLPLGPARDLPAGQSVNDLLPLVLLGDFNSLPESGVTSYLTSGRINSLHKDFKNFKYTPCSNALSCFLGRSLAKTPSAASRPAEQLASSFDDSSAAARHPENQLRRQSSPAWCFYSASASTSGASSLASSPQSKHIQKNNRTNAAGDNILNYNHPFSLRSAYQEDTMDYTNYTTNFKAVIDYIFYSQASIRLLGLLGPLDKNWLRGNQILGLPQPHLPSDHLPLLVRLELLPTPTSASTPEVELPPKQRAPSQPPASSSRKRIKQANIVKLMAEEEAAEAELVSPAGQRQPPRRWTTDYSHICQARPALGMRKTMNLLNQLSKPS